MNIRINNKSINRIYKTPILQQTSFWSKVKKKQGVDSQAFDIKVEASDLNIISKQNNYIVDDILVLFHEIGNGYKIGYVPYGPTIKPSEDNQGKFLEELSELLRYYLPKNCLFLRYDLLWESLWAQEKDRYNPNGEWMGPPEKKNQEIRMNIETRNWNLKKANTNILPSDTIFIDLDKDENVLLNKMRPKTRYNIKLSIKKGVKVQHVDLDNLNIWYELYKQTCLRNHIFLHDQAYFKTVLETKIHDTSSPVKVELLIAEFNKSPIAAMFLAYSGQRATYLYGASSSSNRQLMGTYALQWEAIKRAKNKGCVKYDMFGIAPQANPSHPLFGLYRFKKGFGGEIFHRMGCWDYPFNPEKYEQYLSAEMTSTGYHLG